MPKFASTKREALDTIRWLQAEAKAGLDYETIRPYVATLARSNVYQVYGLPQALTVHRARLLEGKEPPNSADALGPPPASQATTFGRCNRPNKPLLYCSLSEEIALAEVDAQLAAQYIVATFTLPKDSRLIRIGDFDFYRRTGETAIGNVHAASTSAYEAILSSEDWITPAAIDAFLADQFISGKNYEITSAFADVLLGDELRPSQPIDAIAYPSVAFRHGLNFAVRPEAYISKLKLVETETKIIEIIEVIGYGMFCYRQIATLKRVTPTGLLDWDLHRYRRLLLS